ncbi:AMP-binding protein [Aestuariivirga litoralis]|uniref:AMP-binding protein n=1 Tax=Aestuariivirga litoralis TaxID=2650924 RepID=UPI0018C75F32|nr:AMP-binding protein [Aestuariivirga litoralis]
MTFSRVAAARDPDALFIRGDDGRDFTYGEFWALAGRLAAGLVAVGAKPGDRIAVQVEKSVEAVALFYACARAGLIFLPLNTAYTQSEIAYFLSDAEPALFINSQAQLMELAQGGEFDDAVTDASTICAILYTSGTTGKSKGAMLSQGNLVSNAEALVSAWRFTSQDKLIHALPVYHTHGLFVATNTIFLSGGQMFFREKFDASDVIGLIPKATALMGVPTFYTRLLQREDFTRELCASMRLFISGSAPLLAETHRAFEARTGQAILERYGMTETNMNTSNPYDGARKPGTVGKPLPGVDLRIRDGMIEVKGPNVTSGYWRNEAKTKASFTDDGYFITGDLGAFDEDGYVVISGRGSDLIITGGFNVYPKEIEEKIDQLPGVVESAVIGLPHPDFGEAVTAVIVPEKGVTLDAAAIIAKLRETLAAFKVPKTLHFVDELPRNAMGKVQKKALRETYGAR